MRRSDPRELLEEPDPAATPTAVDVPGSRRASMNAPVYAMLADELASGLERLSSDDGRRRAAEARRLASKFRAWIESPPTDEERRAAGQELLEFHRSAIDLLSHGTR